MTHAEQLIDWAARIEAEGSPHISQRTRGILADLAQSLRRDALAASSALRTAAALTPWQMATLRRIAAAAAAMGGPDATAPKPRGVQQPTIDLLVSCGHLAPIAVASLRGGGRVEYRVTQLGTNALSVEGIRP